EPGFRIGRCWCESSWSSGRIWNDLERRSLRSSRVRWGKPNTDTGVTKGKLRVQHFAEWAGDEAKEANSRIKESARSVMVIGGRGGWFRKPSYFLCPFAPISFRASSRKSQMN